MSADRGDHVPALDRSKTINYLVTVRRRSDANGKTDENGEFVERLAILLSTQMPLSPLTRAEQLREYGLTTAHQLRLAAQTANPDDKKELLALEARMTLCNERRNTWIGEDIHNSETGELFEGFGRFWQCGSKLCSYCCRTNARRNRKTLQDAVAIQRLYVGQHYRFITLTIPNLGLSIPASRAIVNRAWELLRKRSFFVGFAVGGAKSEEFTRTSSGFHYHLHLLAKSKHVKAETLRREWTDCVRIACRDLGHEFNVNTSDGLLLVNIKIVHDLKQVVNEVCKYITKVTTWWKMPTEALAEVALVPRWHRMFELFGSFRKPRTPRTQKEIDDVIDGRLFADAAEDDDPLHHPRNHWRLTIKQISLSAYIRRLKAEYLFTLQNRAKVLQLKFPFATITTLDDS